MPATPASVPAPANTLRKSLRTVSPPQRAVLGAAHGTKNQHSVYKKCAAVHSHKITNLCWDGDLGTLAATLAWSLELKTYAALQKIRLGA